MTTQFLTMRTISQYLPEAVMMHADLVLDQPLKRIVTDSRKILKDDFFVAIAGEKFDAHDFLTQVQQAGAIGSLISNAARVPEQLPVALVNDTVLALGELAKAWRLELAPTVVVVTGSNGKTTVKEMIASIFRAAVGQEHSLSTDGNLNNEIGLPLTLLRLTSEHQLAVIELGMNHPGETKALAEIASPNITLINNAQREHQEFMQTVEAVAQEHALAIQALPTDGCAVFPGDSPYTDIWSSVAEGRPIFTFAFNTEETQNQSQGQTDVTGRWHEKGQLEISSPHWSTNALVQLKTLGDHNAKNALAATAVGLAAGVSKEAIIQGLEAFEAVGGRMRKLEIKIGKTLITLVDDTYNANPDSVLAAIQAIEDIPGKHWLVLGDMGEVGDQGPVFHREIGEYAAQHQIDQLWTIGELSSFTEEAFAQVKALSLKNSSKVGQHCNSMEQLTSQLTDQLKASAVQLDPSSSQTSNQTTSQTTSLVPSLVILVKGSRFTKMERVIQHLLSMEDQCYSS